MTPAIRVLQEHSVLYSEHRFTYKEHGGTAWSAEQMGVEEHAVVKTLIFEDDKSQPLVVLMHGDRTVSLKALARSIGCKRVAPCKPEVASRHSGYLIGGTSPFGTRKLMPVYIEASILTLPTIYINGGQRGYLIGLSPTVLSNVLSRTTLVNVAESDAEE
jgi:Cys-tRNA(Pro) deacylase